MISATLTRVREKPHHVRRQIALVLAAGLTALIAIVWFVGNVAMGSYALSSGSFASSGKTETAPPASALSDLLGAAGAALRDNTPAHIEIVDATAAEGKTTAAEPTIIPF